MQFPRLCATLLTATLMSGASVTALPKITNAREPLVLTHEDAILYGRDGRLQVMRKDELALVQDELLGLHGPKPAIIQPKNPQFLAENTDELDGDEKGALERRCTENTIFAMGNTTKFVGNDVLMSSVIKSPDESVTRITVAAGFSISNGINPGVGGSFDVIEKFLKLNYHFDYIITWTTQYTASYTFEVPAGMVGAVVSNPTTTRHSGFYDIGCVGEAKRITFYTDIYTSKSYDSLNWVDGVITVCLGRTWPLHQCIGDGHF